MLDGTMPHYVYSPRSILDVQLYAVALYSCHDSQVLGDSMALRIPVIASSNKWKGEACFANNA